MVFLIILSVFFSLDSRVNRFIMALAFCAEIKGRTLDGERDGRGRQGRGPVGSRASAGPAIVPRCPSVV